MKAAVLLVASLLAGCADQPRRPMTPEERYQNDQMLNLGLSMMQGRPLSQPSGTTVPSSFMTRHLRNQWQNGPNRMCQYSDGSVINYGMNLCPLTLN